MTVLVVLISFIISVVAAFSILPIIFAITFRVGLPFSPLLLDPG